MNIEDYRKNPEKVTRARVLLENTDLQEMLGTVLLTAPCSTGVDPNISPQLAQIIFGAETGHFRFYTLMLSLGQHLVPPKGMDDAAMKLEPED